MCILLGCDYCDTIRGIGPKRALQLIKQYGDIETILKHLDTKKYVVPDNFPYKEVRELFKSPDVKTGTELSSEVRLSLDLPHSANFCLFPYLDKMD